LVKLKLKKVCTRFKSGRSKKIKSKTKISKKKPKF
jgi:hypothetical protein